MKTFVAIIFFTVATVFAEDYKFPGWGCKDIEKLKNAVSNAKKEADIATSMMLLKYHEQKIKTFDDFCKMVDNVCEEVYAVPAQREKAKNLLKKQFAYCRGQFLQEACVFAEETPSWYDYYLARAYNKNKAQSYRIMRNTLLTVPCYVYTVKQHTDGIKRLIETGKAADIKTVRTDLQKLRDKYVSQQLKDKNTWKTVFNEIDTFLKQ